MIVVVLSSMEVLPPQKKTSETIQKLGNLTTDSPNGMRVILEVTHDSM
jgi:hypothetical protein